MSYNSSDKRPNFMLSSRELAAFYKKDIDDWIEKGNSVYNMRLIPSNPQKGTDKEYIIGWNETQILVIQANHLQILCKMVLDRKINYEVKLQRDPENYILSVIWAEGKRIQHFELSCTPESESSLLSLINVLLHKPPYQIDIDPDDELPGFLPEGAQCWGLSRFVYCLCDPVLDYFWDKHKKIKLFQNRPLTEYLFCFAIDGIAFCIYKDGTKAEVFYFPWEIVSSLSYNAIGRKINIETIYGNRYMIPISLKKTKEVKELSERYFYLVQKYGNDHYL